MTSYTTRRKRRIERIVSSHLTLLLILTVLTVSLLFSDEISHSVKSGLSLSVNVIIPSVFPFIIISDFLYSAFDFSELKFLNRSFEKLFGVNRSGVYAFFLGILCGFPLGVKCVRDLYMSGELSKDEAERLIGFCNNTGPAFLVCGVGAGLRGSTAEGILLYIIMVISAIAVGMLFGIGKKSTAITPSPSRKDFSLTLSIKNAGINTLTICSYLTFFACACGLLRKLLGETVTYISILPFIEIGSSSSILSKTRLLTDFQSFAVTAFAVGFSGLSVHLQALSFISDTDIRAGKYFIMKLLQGVISFILAIMLYPQL